MALIKISRGNDVLFETWADGENITSLASAIRTVQKESNVFLTKMVEEEKSSNNNTEKQAGDKNDDDEDADEDEDSDEDNADKSDTIEVEAQKKRNAKPQSSKNAKKFCPDK